MQRKSSSDEGRWKVSKGKGRTAMADTVPSSVPKASMLPCFPSLALALWTSCLLSQSGCQEVYLIRLEKHYRPGLQGLTASAAILCFCSHVHLELGVSTVELSLPILPPALNSPELPPTYGRPGRPLPPQ